VTGGWGAGAEALPRNDDGTKSRGAGDGVAEGHAGEGVSRVRQRCCRRGHQRLASLSGGLGSQRGGCSGAASSGCAVIRTRAASRRLREEPEKLKLPAVAHAAGEARPPGDGAGSRRGSASWRRGGRGAAVPVERGEWWHR
jgi:hypothetical protein